MEITNSFVKAIRPVGFLLVASFLVYAGGFITIPFLPVVLVEGLCPGKKKCSEVVFFTGALQLGTSIGTVLLTPILGGISDDYGRKPIFLLIVFTSVLPPAAALGENPPFHMIGLPFFICGASMVVAWLFSMGLPPLTSTQLSAEPAVHNQGSLPPEDFPEDSTS